MCLSQNLDRLSFTLCLSPFLGKVVVPPVTPDTDSFIQISTTNFGVLRWFENGLTLCDAE
ncbi:hypothetical protein V1478_012299 [Vespula squamosa]|uniref:Uncharacterized protein n=1 Tax=Vespula squamosa TaxID=30214 RepID=A0ABD2ACT2_VESSQ